MALAVDRDVTLLHRLKKSRLRLGRRSVDFIGQQNVDEYRTLSKDEIVGSLIKNVRADDIAGHEVGRELDASIVQVKGLRKRPHEQRLCHPGNTFEQDVAVRQNGDQGLFDNPILTTDGLRDLFSSLKGKCFDRHVGDEGYPCAKAMGIKGAPEPVDSLK